MRRTFFIFTISFSCFLLFSEENFGNPETKLQLINYGIEQGLSQSTVLSIYQDNHGFMWFGTRDGLNRFDGYEFETFRNIPGDSTSLPENYINDITGDDAGNIWIATNSGLSRYNPDKTGFENFFLDTDRIDPMISQVLIDHTGLLWIGTKDGLFILDEKQGKISKPEHHSWVDYVDKNYVIELFQDSRKNLWAGTTEGLFMYDHETRQSFLYHPDRKEEFFISHERVESVVEDLSGKIWAGTYGGGINCILPDTGYAFHINSKSENRIRLTNDYIRSMVVTSDNLLWIGTFQGLNIYDIREQTNRAILHSFTRKSGLSHGSIRSLYTDSKGSVWIGTYMGGLNYYDKDNQKFIHYYHIPGSDNSLSHNVVSDFTENDTGPVFIATERGGLNKFDPESGDFSLVKGTMGSTIKSLTRGNNGDIWIGTFKNGLQRYNQYSGQLNSFPNQNTSFNFLKESSINDICSDNLGNLWVATDKDGGIFKFDIASLEFVQFPLMDTLHGLLQNIRVVSVMKDPVGNIWMGTHGEGIVIFNENDNQIVQYHHIAGDSTSLPGNNVNHIFTDSKGDTWIATNGSGLALFNRQKQTFRTFTTADGLQNNLVMGLLEDEQGFIWVMCINGMSKIDKGDMSFRNYNFKNGLPLKEINEGAFFKRNNQEILLGGSNGFISFNPSEIIENEHIPVVRITSLNLFNEPVLPHQDNNILDKNIINTDTIVLRHYQSIFTIGFTALSYFKPEQNHYEYRLDGLEDNWNYVGNKRTANYTNLSEGTYTFMVRAANNDKKWNENITTLTIIVKPPFWETWWAMIIYFIFIVAGILLLRYFALRNTRMLNEIRFKELENARLEEIHRVKLQSFTDVSHEFRTPLTLIIDPLEQVMEKSQGNDEVSKPLSIMHFNAKRLQLLVNQILEIRELESGNVKLNPEPTHLQLLVGNICDTFQSMAKKNKLELTFHNEMEEQLLEVDRDKIEKIVYNLLSNAVKFNKSGGYIKVKLTTINTTDQQMRIKLMVADSGKGIPAEKREKIFQRFYKEKEKGGTGIGLSLTQSLVELMNGTIELESREDEGTTFHIEIPFEITSGKPDMNHLSSKPVPEGYEAIIREDETIKKADVATNEYKPVILLVEDDAELRHYIRDNLEKRFKIVTAKNGKRALEKAEKHNPEVIVSDVMMPEMDGISLCETIKKDRGLSHIPLILLTARTKDIDRLKGLEAGADDYLGKPFIMRELELRIKNLISNRQMIREKFSKQLMVSPKEIQLTGYDEQLIRKIQEVIHDQMGNSEFNVDMLGEKVGLSRVHLYRKLKAITGLTPSDLIRTTRLKTAANMVEQQKINISEVAEKVGFADQHYFSKSFKKQFGLSPSEYARFSQSRKSDDKVNPSPV